MRSGITILILICVAWAAPVQAAQLKIELEDNALVAARYYRLADIARIEPAGGSLARRLAQVEVGRAPRPNQLARISRRAIGARLQAVIPGVLDRFTWAGAESVDVRAIGIAHRGASLRQRARRFLADELRSRAGDFEITSIGRTRDVILPPGKVEIKPRLDSRGLGKRVSVWLDIDVDGRLAQTLPVWFALARYRPALIALRDYDRGAELSASGVETRRIDVTRAKGEVMQHYADTVGMRLRKPAAAGALITREMLQPLPAVIKGQPVEVAVAVGGVTLATRAIALGDGQLQQKIRVKNPASGEAYSVIVTGPAQTRVY